MAGWNYQWISQLCFTPDSWTAPCDVIRIPPTASTTDATVDQIRRLLALLPADGDTPLFVFDAGYDPIALGYELADTPAQMLCRIRDDRVFHADPPPRPNRPARTGGRPPRHGARFKCSHRRAMIWLVAHGDCGAADGPSLLICALRADLKLDLTVNSGFAKWN